MNEINARITLDSSGYKSGVFAVMEENAKMKKSIEDTKRTMSEFKTGNFTAHIGADTTSATRSISKMQENINALKKNVSVTISAKDAASSSISRIKSEVNSLVKSNFSLEIKALDKTKSVITGIRDSIFNLKTLAAGIVLGAGAKQGFDLTIGNAMSNEQYLSTLQTVLHSNEAGSSALKWSYKEAASTPFDAKQVVAGVTQLATSGLDYKKYLQPLGDAAAAFNKPLEQAIFAMGKLKSGQLGMGVDMLRDFGVSQQDWTKQGVKFSKNGEMQGMTGDSASVMALKILQSKYGGLMDKQSGTAQGMISNIGDTINGMGRGLAGIDQNGQIMKGGLFDNFKKQLTIIMPLLDKIQNSHAFSELQKEIGQLATAGGDKITAFLKSLQDPKNITKYKNEFKDFVKEAKNGAMEIGKFVASVGKIIIALAPLATFIASHQTLFIGIWGGAKGISMGISIFKTVDKLKTEFPILGVAISKFSSGAVKSLGLISKIFVGNPWVVAIGLIVLAVVGLYEAWQHNWGGIQEKTQSAVKEMKLAWDDLKKAWEELKKFFEHPIDAIIKFSKEGSPLSTVYNNDPTKKNALGTNYFEGGETWVGENGPEILKLPGGSKIISNRESMNMVKPKNNQLPNMAFSSTIASQSKSMNPETNKWGQDIPDNLAKGIKNNTKSVTDAVTFMATKIRELIHFSVPDKGPLSDFDTYSVDMLKNFGTGIKNNTKLVIDPTTNMSTGVKTVYSQLSTESNTYGQQAIQEFGNGVQNMTNNLTDIVKTLTDKVIQQFKSGFGIHSPSKVMFEMGGHLMQGLINGMTNKDMEGFITNWIGSMTSAAGSAVSGNLAGWITAAMALTGVGPEWYGPLAQIIEHESSGNPNDINLWDYNAQHGDPSRGLMQLTGENMADYHLPGMTNIYDPVSNIAAGIQYIKSRYGSVYNVPGIRALAEGRSYVGYANGGITDQPSIFGEGQYAEAAIPLKKNSSRSQQLLDIADNYINGDKASLGKTIKITIAKLADQIIVREDADIDKIATALAKKLTIAEMNI
ncbi:transglycosylase SLT domain-containing protein [Clostridium scatologenes]|uniref:Phage tail tape measure protein n=1 Tax=Clostridium scatologenes TaxID=1548 RepID=A0A0E3JMV6_CLOSL|nr:transglycosylase SLT domain-containing protein [Clostridium scatologenes]AKA68554.1 phage tail tape measure protein [Clostridium scatologenes]